MRASATRKHFSRMYSLPDILTPDTLHPGYPTSGYPTPWMPTPWIPYPLEGTWYQGYPTPRKDMGPEIPYSPGKDMGSVTRKEPGTRGTLPCLVGGGELGGRCTVRSHVQTDRTENITLYYLILQYFLPLTKVKAV